MKLKIFFCQFPNPWALRVSGMGGYTSKCEKKSKSLHPNGYTLFTVKYLKRKSHPLKILKHKGNGRLSMQPLHSKRSKYIAAVISIVAGHFVANLRS